MAEKAELDGYQPSAERFIVFPHIKFSSLAVSQVFTKEVGERQIFKLWTARGLLSRQIGCICLNMAGCAGNL
jgi:hypothetical protein